MAGIYDSCARCGVALTHAPGRGKARKFCGDECLEAAALDRWAARPIKGCGVDGCDKEAVRLKGTQCEAHYTRQRRTGGLKRKDGAEPNGVCLYCGSVAPPKSLFCCDRCGTRHRRGSRLVIECAVCMVSFCPLERNLVCSDACDRKRARQDAKRWIANNLQRAAERWRLAEYKRKARKRAGAYEQFSRLDVFERDQWTCKLCGDPVDKALAWPDPGFATLDHIQPLAKGGDHVLANVQCAHLLCNISKGAGSAARRTYREAAAA